MGILKLCIFMSCAYLVSSQVISRDVVIEQGSVRGYNDDDSRVFSYYGIPYASAPQGEDKFKAPLPPPSWSGVFNATARDIACPQSQPFGIATLDCLVVNVFAPNTNLTNFPVFVYIHGGGYRAGSGREFNPVAFATRGIVAVNFNYRLGAYGFLCLGTEFAPGNAGFKDQSAALKWVRNNVARFGGDPDNVLLAGGSAGAISAELQMLSPMSDDLFHKIALEGSSAVSFITVGPTPIAVAETFARTHGVETSQDLQALENFYRSLTDDQLDNQYPAVGTNVGFKACIESHNIDGVEKFLETQPINIIKSGNYQKRPILSGFTSMEGLGYIGQYDTIKSMMEDDFSQFIPSDLTYDNETNRLETVQKIRDFYFPGGEITYEGFVEFYTDTVFLYPHVLSARLHVENSVPVYLYLWNFNGTVNLPDVYSSPITGPGHIAQTLYLLEFFYSASYENMVAEDYLMQDRIRQTYLNFASYGEPIPSRAQLFDTEWLPAAAGADNYLEFDVDLRSGQYPLGERLAFWDQLYDNATTDSATTNIVTDVLVIVSLLIVVLE